jgi:hypothetical protein
LKTIILILQLAMKMKFQRRIAYNQFGGPVGNRDGWIFNTLLLKGLRKVLLAEQA